LKGNYFKQKRAWELKQEGLTWTVIAERLGYASAGAARKAAEYYAKNG